MNKPSRTDAQREASRRNGAKSKGPVTATGKAKVRFNAVKHGFTADFVVLAQEQPELYIGLLQSLIDEYQPETPAETLAIEEYAIYTWRLRRASNYIALLMSGQNIAHYPGATIQQLELQERVP